MKSEYNKDQSNLVSADFLRNTELFRLQSWNLKMSTDPSPQNPVLEVLQNCIYLCTQEVAISDQLPSNLAEKLISVIVWTISLVKQIK